MKHSPLTVAVVMAAWPTAALAQSLAFDRPSEPAQCDVLDMNADAMTCSETSCELRGNVYLTCERLSLWADEVDVLLGPDQGFAGAVARGNVLLVEGNTVLQCRRLTLAEDRVQGRVDAATFHIKRPPVRRDELGVPVGRDEAVFTGDVERRDKETLHVTDASFTLCDCGDDPPSWVLDATEIDATLGERATLWWPQPRFNLFGLGMVPGPPLLPISLALGDRVTGLLPPEVKFLGGLTWPTVDLPLFVPLGDSWDVTISPGMRFDWGTAFSPVSRWGAPRLGGRVRYAPFANTRGEIQASWTGDFKGVGARRFAEEKGLPAKPSKLDEDLQNRNPNDNEAQLLARRELTHRVSFEIDHRTDFSDELRWLVAAEWLSDDLIANDFKVSLDDRVANYTSSRTQLLWRTPGVSASAAADYLLALGNSKVSDEPWEYDYSNVNGREAGVAHRGPHVQLSLLPWRLADGLHLEADLSFVRYGAWTAARPPDRVVAGGRLGVGYLNRVGPVDLSARAHLDSLWLDPTRPKADLHAAAVLDVEASIRLAKERGNVAHVIEPRLACRALPWIFGELPETPPVDPRLERAELYQLALEIDQSWWRTGNGTRRLGRLTVSQPIDLETGKLLQTRARLDAGAKGVRVGAWADIDFLAGDVEEVGATLSARWRWLSVGGHWARWSPQADRFRRTLYELGATAPALSEDAWVHMIRGSASVHVGSIRGSYSTDYLLPIEEVDCETPDQPESCTGQRVPGFTRHAVSISYTSPCDCWGVGVNVSVPAADPSDLRAQITLDIGGYRVGN